MDKKDKNLLEEMSNSESPNPEKSKSNSEEAILKETQLLKQPRPLIDLVKQR